MNINNCISFLIQLLCFSNGNNCFAFLFAQFSSQDHQLIHPQIYTKIINILSLHLNIIIKLSFHGKHFSQKYLRILNWTSTLQTYYVTTFLGYPLLSPLSWNIPALTLVMDSLFLGLHVFFLLILYPHFSEANFPLVFSKRGNIAFVSETSHI